MVAVVAADGVTEIAAYAYADRTDITEVVLPASVVSIGDGAFCFCTGIVALHLPDTLRSIGATSFQGCSGIVDPRLPDTLRSIGEAAFHGCCGIVDLQLPDALESIGRDAFYQCSGIVALNLPDVLSSLPYVDEDNLGVTGCSRGGTQASYLGAVDPRIKAASIACYMSTMKVDYTYVCLSAVCGGTDRSADCWEHRTKTAPRCVARVYFISWPYARRAMVAQEKPCRR